jgi:hypothetical protein
MIDGEVQSRVLASGAAPWSAIPIDSPAGALFLSADESRTLRAALTDSGVELTIAESVSWFDHISYPASGILYIVDEGPNAGIWLSKAR